MFETLISFVLWFIIVAVNTKKNESLINVSTVFTSIWCICLAISAFGPFGLYKPSTYVYVISFLSIILFNIPMLCRKECNYHIGMEEKNENIVQLSGFVRNPLLIVLNLMSYVFAVPYLRSAINLVLGGGYSSIRSMELSAMGQTTYVALAFQWICLPLWTITIIVAAISVAEKKRNKMLIILSVFDVFIYATVYAGRYIIFKFVFYMLIASLVINKGQLLKFVKTHKKLVLAGVLCVIVLMYLTSLRSLSDMSFLGNIVGYYVGSLSLLSRLLEANVQGSYLGYGHMTFGFVINFVMAVLKVVFGVEYTGSDTIFTSFAGSYFTIGNGIKTNALCTTLYAFILDYGKVFFFIGVLIFSIFSHALESNYYRKRTYRSMIFYMYALFSVFDSVLAYDYMSPGVFVLFVLIFVLTSNNKPVKRIKINI